MVFVEMVRTSSTNITTSYMVPTGGRIALKRSMVAMVEPTAFEIRIDGESPPSEERATSIIVYCS